MRLVQRTKYGTAIAEVCPLILVAMLIDPNEVCALQSYNEFSSCLTTFRACVERDDDAYGALRLAVSYPDGEGKIEFEFGTLANFRLAMPSDAARGLSPRSVRQAALQLREAQQTFVRAGATVSASILIVATSATIPSQYMSGVEVLSFGDNQELGFRGFLVQCGNYLVSEIGRGLS